MPLHISVENHELSELLCSFGELESLGIKPEKETKLSAEDDCVLEHFKETTMLIGEHYQVRLLWWHENMKLSSNQKVAESRFAKKDFAHETPEEKVNIDEVNQYLLVAQENKVGPRDNPENVLFPLDKHDRQITSLRINAWIKRIVFNTCNFSQEIKDLQSGKDVYRKSKIKDLNPFLDDKGMIRVGGRLQK